MLWWFMRTIEIIRIDCFCRNIVWFEYSTEKRILINLQLKQDIKDM